MRYYYPLLRVALVGSAGVGRIYPARYGRAGCPIGNADGRSLYTVQFCDCNWRIVTTKHWQRANGARECFTATIVASGRGKTGQRNITGIR